MRQIRVVLFAAPQLQFLTWQAVSFGGTLKHAHGSAMHCPVASASISEGALIALTNSSSCHADCCCLVLSGPGPCAWLGHPQNNSSACNCVHLLQAIHNITPVLDVRQVRTATKVSYVPGLMPPKKAKSLALHWLVKAAQSRAESSKAR